MRYIELILKLAFLFLAVFVFVTKAFVSPYFTALIVVSFLWGLVMIFNKQSSYFYELSERDLTIRKVEGAILVIFSLFTLIAMNL